MFKKILKLGSLFLLFFILSSVIHVLSIGFFHHTWSPLMAIRNYEALSTQPEYSQEQNYVVLDSMSTNIILAVMCSEDQKFPTHFGFDFDAIRKVMEWNKKHPDHPKGASTISQQTVKNVFLWQKRNFLRKGLEAYYTVLIELLWSKKRIMESYLNIIEMGDGIYGVEAAARYYFEKSAKNLTQDEAAALAAILPNPRKWSPTDPDAEVRKDIRRIKNSMNRNKKLLKALGIERKN